MHVTWQHTICRGGAPLAPALGTLPPFMTQPLPGQHGPGTAYPGGRPAFAGMPPQKPNGLPMSGNPAPAADAGPQACCSLTGHAVACRWQRFRPAQTSAGLFCQHPQAPRSCTNHWLGFSVEQPYPLAGSADASAAKTAGGAAAAAGAAERSASTHPRHAAGGGASTRRPAAPAGVPGEPHRAETSLRECLAVLQPGRSG